MLWLQIYTNLYSPLSSSTSLHSNPLKFIAILFNTYINPRLPVSDDIIRGIIGAFSAFKYGLPFRLNTSFSLLLSLLHYNKKDQELGECTGKLVYNLATIECLAWCRIMYTKRALLLRFMKVLIMRICSGVGISQQQQLC